MLYFKNAEQDTADTVSTTWNAYQNPVHAVYILGTRWDSRFVQIPLFNILKKFDGEMVTEVVRPQLARMRYRITRLPQYIILHMRRFTKNNFFMEKNPTLGE